MSLTIRARKIVAVMSAAVVVSIKATTKILNRISIGISFLNDSETEKEERQQSRVDVFRFPEPKYETLR